MPRRAGTPAILRRNPIEDKFRINYSEFNVSRLPLLVMYMGNGLLNVYMHYVLYLENLEAKAVLILYKGTWIWGISLKCILIRYHTE